MRIPLRLHVFDMPWLLVLTSTQLFYSLLAVPLGYCGWDVMLEQAQNILVDIGLEVPTPVTRGAPLWFGGFSLFLKQCVDLLRRRSN